MASELKRLDAWDPPEQWGDIERRVPREIPPERLARSRLAAGLVAATVAIAGLGFVFLQFRSLDEPTDTGQQNGIQRLHVTQRTIDTGLRFPEGAVSAYGSVWVATRHPDQSGGHVVRLDPRTGDEVARIAVPSLPGWTFGGAGITSGLDSVWVTGSGSGDQAATVVFRIDPSSGALEETIDVGPGSDADVWVDDSGIWVLTFPPRGGESLLLYRVDPTTHRVSATTQVPASWSQNVFAAGGWVYVWAGEGGSDPGATLFRIDPDTAEIEDRVQPGRGTSFSIVPSGDRIWFFDEGLRALDAGTAAEVVGPLTSYSEAFCCSLLVGDGTGGVWVMSGKPTAQRKESLVHLDRRGRVVASTGRTLGPDADGIAATFDPSSSSIWIVHYERDVTRLGLTPAPPEPELFSPTAPDEGVYMQALYRGPFLVRDGCALIGQPGSYSIPIWREGFTSARDSSGRLIILDADGATVAVEGQAMEMGGGYVAEFEPANKVEPIDLQLERVANLIGEPVPERCLQPDIYGFWLAGEVQPISP